MPVNWAHTGVLFKLLVDFNQTEFMIEILRDIFMPKLDAALISECIGTYMWLRRGVCANCGDIIKSTFRGA